MDATKKEKLFSEADIAVLYDELIEEMLADDWTDAHRAIWWTCR